ncbi:MAG: hypothetical protein PHV25_01350 [Candidatus Pacebacteria bacterium]|nr:hypothetical protein [Candidatus Paceibacterota bacterium]
MYGVIQTDKIMIFDSFGGNILTESDLGSRAESFSIGSDGAIYSAGENRVYVIR